jgi:L-fuculose-phosphate aldolase
MKQTEKALRQSLITRCRDLEKFGLNQGTAGNLSVRFDDRMLITPSAVPYDLLKPAMIARMPIDKDYGAWDGPLPPSSEWRIHLDILKARPDAGALIHTHSLYATTLSMLRKPIPAAHYMIAAFGGPTIRCTDYVAFGTPELSELALAGLEDRTGVLLGSHGMVVVGKTLDEAMWRAVELETLAKMYYLASSIGEPQILSDDEIARIVERFKTYGYRPPKERADAKSASKTSGAKKKPRKD